MGALLLNRTATRIKHVEMNQAARAAKRPEHVGVEIVMMPTLGA